MNATTQIVTSGRDLALPFFFAVYWSAMIASMETFDVFKIWTIGTEGYRVIFRLIFGVLLLDVVPMVIFVLVYSSTLGVVVPEKAPGAIFCAGIASLSVFSVVFLLPGILQMGLGKLPYPTGQWAQLVNAKFSLGPGKGICVLIITGLAYIAIPIATSWYIAQKFT